MMDRRGMAKKIIFSTITFNTVLEHDEIIRFFIFFNMTRCMFRLQMRKKPT